MHKRCTGTTLCPMHRRTLQRRINPATRRLREITHEQGETSLETMLSYSLFPGQYVRPSPPSKPQSRSHKEKKPAGLAIITTPIPPRPGPPPNRPLPPFPGTAGSVPAQPLEKPLYEIDGSAHPLSARYAKRDVHDLTDSLANFFGGLFHESGINNEEARSPSLRPIPSSPTLRRRHLPKIRTRPLTPGGYDQKYCRAQQPPIDARPIALPPPVHALRRRASFGSGPTLDLPSSRPSQASGMRILKRSDNNKRKLSQEAPTDLSFLPVVPVDLSFYLNDHAGEMKDSCYPIPACVERPASPTGKAADGLRQLRRKVRYSRLREDRVYD